jgi:transposase
MEMGEKRKQYSQEFKIGAVRMLEGGKSGREIEKELGIGSGLVYRWREQLKQAGNGIRAFPGNGRARDEELDRLRRENRSLREERDILRKAVAIFSKPPRTSTGS